MKHKVSKYYVQELRQNDILKRRKMDVFFYLIEM